MIRQSARPKCRQWWDRVLHFTIAICAFIFIAILGISAWMEPPIRVLHFLQSLIYVAVIFLCRRRNMFGYGFAIGIAGFWNVANLFVTTFFKAGIAEYMHLFKTGHTQHSEMLMSPIAVVVHFVMILACIAGYYSRPEKSSYDCPRMLVGGLVSVAAFILDIRFFGPQYMYIVYAMVGKLSIRAH